MGVDVTKVYTNHYSELCGVLKNEDGLLSKFVTAGIITTDDEDVIKKEKLTTKGSTLLNHISGPVQSGYTKGFYTMLNIMKSHGKSDAQELADKILQECQGADAEKQPTDSDKALNTVDTDDDTLCYDSRKDEEPTFSYEDLEEMYKEVKIIDTPLVYHELSEEQLKIFDEVQAVIVVVNEKEFMATLHYLKPPKDDSEGILEIHRSIKIGQADKPRIFFIGKFGQCIAAVTQVPQGGGRDAIEHIDCFKKLKLVAAVGVAAGFPENKVRMGDVLVSEKIIDCSHYKHDEKYIPRGFMFPGSNYMIQRLQKKMKWKFQCTKTGLNCSVVCGDILSKNVLLNNKEERRKILSDFWEEAKGYEMEGFSLANGGIDIIVIKGVCDFASGKNKKWQPTAALAANDYLHFHLSRLDLRLKPSQVDNDGHADVKDGCDGLQHPPKENGADTSPQKSENLRFVDLVKQQSYFFYHFLVAVIVGLMMVLGISYFLGN